MLEGLGLRVWCVWCRVCGLLLFGCRFLLGHPDKGRRVWGGGWGVDVGGRGGGGFGVQVGVFRVQGGGCTEKGSECIVRLTEGLCRHPPWGPALPAPVHASSSQPARPDPGLPCRALPSPVHPAPPAPSPCRSGRRVEGLGGRAEGGGCRINGGWRRMYGGWLSNGGVRS